MPWIIQKTKRWYHHWLVWTTLGLTIAGFFAWPKMKSRYRLWNAKRQIEQAGKELGRGDYRRAMLMARNALEVLPGDADATGIMAKGCESAGAAALAVQWRCRLNAIIPGDPENIIAWSSDAMKTGDMAAAERILEMARPEPSRSAAFHVLKAKIALTKHDSVAAGNHWAEAARIEPSDDDHRLHLATIRLDSKSPEHRVEALATLRELSHKPAKGVGALRVLLADARKHEVWSDAYEHANSLVAAPSATFEDKLARLGTLRAMKLLESATYLEELRSTAISNPSELYLLFMWMNQNNLPFLVSEWTRYMPADVVQSLPTCVAVADACARSLEWERLLKFVESCTWGESDYLRRAFRARALEKLGEEELSAGEWTNAVSSARSRGDSPERLERIIRLAIHWGWDRRAQEIMWTMAGTPRCPRWMLEALWLIAVENSDAAQLQKLAGVLVQTDSKSPAYRNSYAFYSLLLRCEDGNPHREAEQLFKERPNDPGIAITRSLSLHQQGKSADALAVIESLPSEQMDNPQVAFYHALYLTATGENAKAVNCLFQAKAGKILPEEKSLLERAKVAAASMEASSNKLLPSTTEK